MVNVDWCHECDEPMGHCACDRKREATEKEAKRIAQETLPSRLESLIELFKFTVKANATLTITQDNINLMSEAIREIKTLRKDLKRKTAANTKREDLITAIFALAKNNNKCDWDNG